MTEKEYRASPGISRSELWRLNPRAGGTPEKFMYAQKNPEPPTPAMVFGTLAHLALLEPHRFVDEFTFEPEGIDRRTKAGKALWAEFLEACRLFCLPFYHNGDFGVEGEQFAEWYAQRKKEEDKL